MDGILEHKDGRRCVFVFLHIESLLKYVTLLEFMIRLRRKPAVVYSCLVPTMAQKDGRDMIGWHATDKKTKDISLSGNARTVPPIPFPSGSFGSPYSDRHPSQTPNLPFSRDY